MNAANTCSSCGAVLPAGTPAGNCLACLLGLGLPAAAAAGETSAATAEMGEKIEGYRLLQVIGEGGSGVVYLAEQERPVRRRVAVKIIKPGMDTRQVIARFEAERQTLALMEHPNITRVFDAGSTQGGRPYFVMELVRGVKITDYADQKRLSTRQRLDLFIQVCRGIQHAHQKGIVHRDLKPSNVLVTEEDGVALPKIIDFGIAKATTGQQLTDATLFTAFDHFIGTPAYMSPEQAGLGSLDVDTRSDIYSLGVLLYELLTGQPPFDARELRRMALDDIFRMIREREPSPPSARLNALSPQKSTTAAQRRQTEPRKLSLLLRGDLDWIVMKTLEKDRNRRYETATGLAADLKRYLDNEIVEARPPGKLYRLQKMVRRHRLAFAAGGAIFAVLLLGTVVSTWQAVRATRAEREENRLRQEAETERQNERQLRQKAETAEITAQTAAVKSRQVAKFLTDMIGGVEAHTARGRDTSILHEILDQAASRIDVELKDQPEAQADMMEMLGNTYAAIYQLPAGEEMFRKALAVRKKFEGNESAAIANLLLLLSGDLGREYKMDESLAVEREALAMAKKLYAKNPDRDLRVKIFYASLYLGEGLSRQREFDEAETRARDALAMLEGSADFGYGEREAGLLAYSRILHAEGKAAEAETASREVLAARIKRSGPEDLGVATAERNVADALLDQDKLDEAEPLYRDCIRIYGAQRIGTATLNGSTAVKRLGEVLRKRRNLPEAEKYIREALATRVQLFEEPHPILLDTRQEFFRLLCEEGKYPEAETELRQWLKGERLRCAAKPALLALGVGQMADFLYARGKTNEAAPLYQEVMNTCLPALREDDAPSLGNVAWIQATCLAPAFRNPANAVRLAEKAVQLTARRDPEPLGVLAAAYAADGQFERAVEVEKEAAQLPQEAIAKAELVARLARDETHQPYRSGN